MEKIEKDRFVLKVVELFMEVAKKEGVRMVINKKSDLLGIRIKKAGREVSMNIIFSSLNVIHLCGSPCSNDEYFQETSDLEAEIPKIKSFLEETFKKNNNQRR